MSFFIISQLLHEIEDIMRMSVFKELGASNSIAKTNHGTYILYYIRNPKNCVNIIAITFSFIFPDIGLYKNDLLITL